MGKKHPERPLKHKPAAAKKNWLTEADIVVYVDPEEGDDNNPGTTSQPVKTIAAALRIFRYKKTSKEDQGLISLRAGTHYLSETINITAEDSNLVILGDGHENTFVSGGRNYTLGWKQYRKYMETLQVNIDLMDNVLSDSDIGKSNDIAKFVGMMTSAEECMKKCELDEFCFAFTWYDRSFGNLSNMCYFRQNGLWTPTYAKGAKSGRKVNIIVADLSSQNPIPFTTLFFNRRRAVRARYPDGNPETMGLYTNPTGYIQKAPAWLPIPSTPSPLIVNTSNPQRSGTYYPDFVLHIDGPDAVFDPPKSFFVHRVTTGLQYSPNEGFASRSWKNASTGVVHAFHCRHWGNWMFAIDQRNDTTRHISWSYGGFQEAGAGCAEGAEWLVDNIFEELDAPGEWFYDKNEQKLYLYPNGTDMPSSGVGTTLQRLFDIQGSLSHPVYNITLMNITFQHTEPTYFEPYESPSGGAFSVHRGGAVFVEGVDGFTVQKCLFDSPGGNGIFLRNFVRNAVIEANEFRYVGDNAIAAIGSVNLIDGTSGNQPRGTKITGNLVNEIGIFGKQTCAYIQSLACQTELTGNVFFNGPRAGINFNDGFGGGNLIKNNLIFNMVRETGDHGPFNSWDRQPYITRVKDGQTPSLLAATNIITRNFIINNYHSTWPIDHDDGSCYYNDTFNYLVYGGYKNFKGHSKNAISNVYVYPDAYPQTPLDGYVLIHKPYCANHDGAARGDRASGFDEVYANNTCIIGNPDIYEFGTCNPDGDDKGLIPLTYNNTFYAPKREIYIKCKSKTFTLEQFQALGYDKGSVVNDIVDTETVIKWGRELLNI